MARLLCPLHQTGTSRLRQKERHRPVRRQTLAGDGLPLGISGEVRSISHEQPCRADVTVCRLLAQTMLRQRQREGPPLGGENSFTTADLPTSNHKNLPHFGPRHRLSFQRRRARPFLDISGMIPYPTALGGFLSAPPRPTTP